MDKRYKFIRSKDPFEGLDDYRRATYFEPVRDSVGFPIQLSFLNGCKVGDGSELRTKEGKFFELIGKGMYGGSERVIYENGSRSKGNQIQINPDLKCEKGILHEFKGTKKSREVKLRDDQMSKYILLNSKEFFKESPILMFDIFGHGINKIQAEFREKNLEDMIKALSKSIRYHVSLPFSVIFEAYVQDDKRVSDRRVYTSRHDREETYATLTRLHSTAINEFIAYPEKMLNEFGFDVDRFEIEKKRFPSGFKINNFELRPFPMLFIRDKEYSKFLDGLEERVKSNELLSERLRKETRGLMGGPVEKVELPDWLRPPIEGVPF